MNVNPDRHPASIDVDQNLIQGIHHQDVHPASYTGKDLRPLQNKGFIKRICDSVHKSILEFSSACSQTLAKTSVKRQINELNQHFSTLDKKLDEDLQEIPRGDHVTEGRQDYDKLLSVVEDSHKEYQKTYQKVIDAFKINKGNIKESQKNELTKLAQNCQKDFKKLHTLIDELKLMKNDHTEERAHIETRESLISSHDSAAAALTKIRENLENLEKDATEIRGEIHKLNQEIVALNTTIEASYKKRSERVLGVNNEEGLRIENIKTQIKEKKKKLGELNQKIATVKITEKDQEGYIDTLFKGIQNKESEIEKLRGDRSTKHKDKTV